MTARQACIAVLDFGTSGGKCAIFDESGRCRAAIRTPWTYTSAPFQLEELTGGYTFDSREFWRLLCGCSHDALQESGVAPDEIVAVAVTALRLGTVFLSGSGEVLYSGPNMDGRGLAGGFKILEKIDQADLLAITGHWPPFISSLARVLWFLDQERGGDLASVLTLSDWLGFQLSGELGAERSNSGETSLFDVRSQSWSQELTDLFEVDPNLLPPLRSCSEPLGTLTSTAAEETGLPAGIPVFLAGADTQCALLGSGVVEPTSAGLVLGTTAPLMQVATEPLTDATGQVWAGCHVVDGRWTLEANAGDAGVAWEWFLGMLGLTGERGFAEAEILAGQAEGPLTVFSNLGPQVFDLVNFNPNRPHGILFRQRPFHARPTREDLVRSFLANLACASRANLEKVARHHGSTARSLTLSGGMTRSQSLLRMFARIFDVPLRVSEEPNATALGGAIIGAAGAGLYGSAEEAAGAMVRTHEVPLDRSAPDEADAHYAQWCELDARLKEISLP